MFKKNSVRVSALILVLACITIAFAQNSQGPVKPGRDKEQDFECSIRAIAKATLALKKPTLTAGLRGANGSFSGPSVCGAVFKPDFVIANGVPIAVNAVCSVSDPAEEGEYTFHLYVKVTDQSGKILKEASSHTKCKKGNGSDLGYFDKIQHCYCDATKITVEVALASISPSNKFVLHQFMKTPCEFEIKP